MRITCFRDGNRWVCREETYGLTSRGDTKAQAYKLMWAMLDEFLTALYNPRIKW